MLDTHSFLPQIFLELLLDTGPALDAEGSVVNKIDKNPSFCETDIFAGETENKRVNRNINEI